MSNNVVKSTVVVSILLAVGYLISFFKETLVAYFFGVSADVDAYSVAIGIPVNLFSIIAISIQPIVIPIYTRLLHKESIGSASNYINSLITFIIVICIILLVILELLAGPIIYLFAPGFSSETHMLAVTLLRVTLPTIVFTLISRVYCGILNVYKQFSLPTVSIYFLNVFILIFILLLHKQCGILSACIGQFAGGVGQLLFLIIISRKHYHYKVSFDIRNENMITTGKNILPIMLSTSISEINAIFSRTVASMLVVGSIAAYNYASKIESIVLHFFITAITTIVYPLYAESAVKDNTSQLSSRVNSILLAYVFLLIPLTIGIITLRRELMEVAFARGAFDGDAVVVTSGLLGILSIGMLFYAFRENLVKVFYALEDTKTPAKNTMLGMGVSILLLATIPFINKIGVYGLAIACSASYIFMGIRLLVILEKRHKMVSISDLLRNTTKIIIPAVLMFICVLLTRILLSGYGSIVRLSVSTMVGILVYIGVSLFLRIPIALQLKKSLLNGKKQNKATKNF